MTQIAPARTRDKISRELVRARQLLAANERLLEHTTNPQSARTAQMKVESERRKIEALEAEYLSAPSERERDRITGWPVNTCPNFDYAKPRYYPAGQTPPIGLDVPEIPTFLRRDRNNVPGFLRGVACG